MQCKDILQLKLQTGIKNIHVNQCMGIQELRLNACIYGSNFAYKKFTWISKVSRQRDTGRKRTSTMVIKTSNLMTFRFKLQIMIFKIYFQM